MYIQTTKQNRNTQMSDGKECEYLGQKPKLGREPFAFFSHRLGKNKKSLFLVNHGRPTNERPNRQKDRRGHWEVSPRVTVEYNLGHNRI